MYEEVDKLAKGNSDEMPAQARERARRLCPPPMMIHPSHFLELALVYQVIIGCSCIKCILRQSYNVVSVCSSPLGLTIS